MKKSRVVVDEGYKLGHFDDINYDYDSGEGLTGKLVEEISSMKHEPFWMKERRMKALALYEGMPIPKWGGDLGEIEFEKIHYYLKPTNGEGKTWDDVPDLIKKTFEKIGVPEAEKVVLSGVKAQYDSEVIYGSLRKSLSKKGVVFLGMDEGLKQYPELVKEYFGKVVPLADNKLAALNSAVWSGGSFIYVPKNVVVDLPLQAYFRINAKNAGQFERTLIIADEGSKVHYLEGCSAPSYSSGSLHSAVVEVFVKKGARVQYTTVQNWYKNVYNLVTKRAWVEEEAEMLWVDGNLGCVTGNTLVSTPKGYVEISKLSKGDVVYSFDFDCLGMVKTIVTGWRKTGEKQTFRLTTEDHRNIEATDNHPFLRVKKRNGFEVYEIGWVQLGELVVGDLIGIMTSLPDDGVLKNNDFVIDTKNMKNIPSMGVSIDEDLMWFLGAYIGDGCLDGVSRVDLAIPENDKAHDDTVRILRKWGLKWSQRKVTKRIGSTYLAKMIVFLGFGGNAKTKRIPEWVYGLPRCQKLAFIHGYMMTDGHVRKRKVVGKRLFGQITFASANKLLLEQLRLLMYTCGLEPKAISRYLKERRLYKGILKEYDTYYLSMNLNGNYETIITHKYEGKNVRFVKVREIENIGVQEVFDIEVEKGHNFIANGIIVHNSKLTMKYPACVLAGRKAKGEMLSLAFAGAGQHQDTGAKMIHLASETSSRIIAKSVCKDGGRTSYRGLVKVIKGAKNVKNKVVCDALILDEKSRSDTYPKNEIMESEVTIEHEASVSKVGEEQLFYLMSRGVSEHEAEALIVNGFLEPIVKQIPLEYAVEMNRLVDMEMEGSVG